MNSKAVLNLKEGDKIQLKEDSAIIIGRIKAIFDCNQISSIKPEKLFIVEFGSKCKAFTGSFIRRYFKTTLDR